MSYACAGLRPDKIGHYNWPSMYITQQHVVMGGTTRPATAYRIWSHNIR